MSAAQAEFRFAGPDLTPQDTVRLGHQLVAVLELMSDGHWRTLRRISEETGAPEASVSARLRDARKVGWTVERRRAAPGSGTWLYRALREGAP
jgi:hypothetical protein